MTKTICVFLDGTRNDASTRTNVQRLYELVEKQSGDAVRSIYVPGVGTDLVLKLTGATFGVGMQERIRRGYSFVAEHHRPGDAICLFGFSRGAHQARALAGLIALVGLPDATGRSSDDLDEIADDLLDLSSERNDDEFDDEWAAWRPGLSPPLAGDVMAELGLRMRPAEVDFLGVWDTVPGSSFKEYENGKEKIGWVKRRLNWVPGIDGGHRYKSDSYPPIRRIAHAVALDEKRSAFAPLLLCPPITAHTVTDETWFPGAHADVGGGYGDSNELAGVSLNWMLDRLAAAGLLDIASRVPENAAGLAHWSIGDAPGNVGSDHEHRTVPGHAAIHPSVAARTQASPVPIRVRGRVQHVPYPHDPAWRG